MKRISIYEHQANRQRGLPEDRIAFLGNNDTAAEADKAVFTDWYKHGRWKKGVERKLALQKAMRQIAENNYLDEITEDQFFTALEILGYYKEKR